MKGKTPKTVTDLKAAPFIAAEMLGRKCAAIELEPRYVDVCVQRWQNFTNQKAKRPKA
jgi:DNA modification methylase